MRLKLLDHALDLLEPAGHQRVGDVELARGFEHHRLRLRAGTSSSSTTNADGLLSPRGRADGPDRLAPTENGGSVCQMITPLKLRSASSMACMTPSSTSSPIACILLLKLTIADVVAGVPQRTASVSNTVLP